MLVWVEHASRPTLLSRYVAPSCRPLVPTQFASRALNVFFLKPRLTRPATTRPTPPSHEQPRCPSRPSASYSHHAGPDAARRGHVRLHRSGEVHRPLPPTAAPFPFSICPSILSLLWAYPWFWVLIVGNLRASRWQVLSEEASRAAQVNQDNLLQRKWCPHCEIRRPDRTYHDDMWNCCLPVYDHPCSFFPAPILVGTQEPYLFALAFIPSTWRSRIS